MTWPWADLTALKKVFRIPLNGCRELSIADLPTSIVPLVHELWGEGGESPTPSSGARPAEYLSGQKWRAGMRSLKKLNANGFDSGRELIIPANPTSAPGKMLWQWLSFPSSYWTQTPKHHLADSDLENLKNGENSEKYCFHWPNIIVASLFSSFHKKNGMC